jgi:hypothetical protein
MLRVERNGRKQRWRQELLGLRVSRGKVSAIIFHLSFLIVAGHKSVNQNSKEEGASLECGDLSPLWYRAL